MKKKLKNGKTNEIIRVETETKKVFQLDKTFSFSRLSFCKCRDEKMAVIVFYRIVKILNYSSIDVAHIYDIDRQLLNGYHNYQIDDIYKQKELTILENLR